VAPSEAAIGSTATAAIPGRHAVTAQRAGAGRTLLRHVLDWQLSGPMFLAWPLVIRWAHDAVVEEMFDNAERAAGHELARPARRSPWVRLLRALGVPRARAVPPPRTALLDGAFPRVDWSDAHAVEALRGMPHDPQVWADAVFRDPPRWVLAALGLREALVGLVGIDRGGRGAFDTVARADDEVLLGSDANHLDFRASVRREPDRVVLHHRRPGAQPAWPRVLGAGAADPPDRRARDARPRGPQALGGGAAETAGPIGVDAVISTRGERRRGPARHR
jgi:hypothetical protein